MGMEVYQAKQKEELTFGILVVLGELGVFLFERRGIVRY
jgi:hypothetical protein